MLTLLTLTKFWFAMQLPLFGDEAFYWWESTQLAPAYDDVPAATAWLIAASTGLLGVHPWAVRLPFLLLGLLSWWLVLACAREAGGRVAAVWAAWLGALLPLFAANGLLALPDVTLNFAVLLCLLGLQRALRHASGGAWLLAFGLCVGFLSHYRFVLPVFVAGCWLLASREGRGLLRRPILVAAAAAGAVTGLAPLAWQQSQSHAAGLSFQFADRHPWTFQPGHLLDPLAQALITSPLLYIALIAAGLWGLRWRQQAGLRMFSILGLALVALYWLLGAFADAERSRMHWPLPGYLALIVPLSVAWSESAQQWWIRLRRWVLALAAVWLCGAAAYLWVVAQDRSELVRWQLYPSNLSGISAALTAVKVELRTLPPDTLIVADQFMTGAQLQFGLPERQVFSLDHPLNIKHGRQTVLAALGRDERALKEQSPTRALLIISELSATRLRERPAHYRDLCRRFPDAEQVSDLWVDHGSQRFMIWRLDPTQLSKRGCVPPPLAYVSDPEWNAVVESTMQLKGWAIRDQAGIAALRAVIGNRELAMRFGTPVPSLAQILPGLSDPGFPNFGFDVTLDVGAGPQWIELQAIDPKLGWVTVAEWPVRGASK